MGEKDELVEMGELLADAPSAPINPKAWQEKKKQAKQPKLAIDTTETSISPSTPAKQTKKAKQPKSSAKKERNGTDTKKKFVSRAYHRELAKARAAGDIEELAKERARKALRDAGVQWDSEH